MQGNKQVYPVSEQCLKQKDMLTLSMILVFEFDVQRWFEWYFEQDM